MTSKLRQTFRLQPQAVAGTSALCSSYHRCSRRSMKRSDADGNPAWRGSRRAPTASFPPSGTCFAAALQAPGGWRRQDEEGPSRTTENWSDGSPPRLSCCRVCADPKRISSFYHVTSKGILLAGFWHSFPSHYQALTIPTGASLRRRMPSFRQGGLPGAATGGHDLDS